MDMGGHSAKCMELVIEGILEVLRIGEVALVVLVLGEYHLPIVSPLDHVKRIIGKTTCPCLGIGEPPYGVCAGASLLRKLE
ncbi:hypothetical protein VNPA120661_66530 [Pseudomonas aeruginosa]|nr:hypothetical protein TO65_24940 [Pseudomonas aeruginosa]KQK61962.1 hypothetical protein AOX62_05690 [Pseudomonas aeruginosa]KQK65984.1 hypothetical protein AOX61_05430 [Pseudomonas aeruginosa]OFB76751.1 hypothetical protein AN471_31200 [Pseudomonas aeruginosa]GLE86320.1 hypothetical protein VNPA120661_66530 [Pseudomonas aeruginosa]